MRLLVLESDRGCVLVATAAIDEVLGKMLHLYFLRTGSANARDRLDEEIDFLLEKRPLPPLGSMAIRIKISYVLGLLSDVEKQALSALADLRNTFAHISEPVELVADDVNKISVAYGTPGCPRGTMVDDYEMMRTWEPYVRESDAKSFSLQRYRFMCYVISLYLTVCMRQTGMIAGPLPGNTPVPLSIPLKHRPVMNPAKGQNKST